MKIKRCEYCKKKYIPRSFKIKNNTFRFMVCSCNCREIEARKKQIRKIYSGSHIDDYFLTNNFPVVDKTLLALKKNISWIKKGKQIIIYGNPGNWKTGQITDLAKVIMQDFIKVKYYRASDIPGIGMNDKKQFSIILKSGLLIIDNFGKDKIERAGGILFKLVDYRIHNFLSTILITNYDKLTYMDLFSPEFISRLNGFDKIRIDSDRDLREGIKYENEEVEL